MRTDSVTLDRGLPVKAKDGDEVSYIKDFELRETEASDHIDAGLAGEKLVRTDEGEHKFVQSPMLVGLELLRRQVVRYGERSGPISMAELRKLSTGDLAHLQAKAEMLDVASLAGVLTRGRDDPGRASH